MQSKIWKSIGLCLFFFVFSCVLGPYSLSCISGALLVALFSGTLQAPGYAFISGLLYLIAGTFLPVLPDWNHGMTSGFGALFGPSGGMLLVLPLTAFTVALFQRILIRKPVLNTLAGLAAGFVVFFGFGLLWYVIRAGAPDMRAMGTAFGLYGLFTLVVFLSSFFRGRSARRSGS